MTAILKNPTERKRFLRFMVVGVIGAVVDFTTFNLLNGLLHVSGVIAQAVSFTAAVTSNFLWNRYWTYPDSRSKPLARQLVQFFVVNLIGLLIRTPIFAGLEKPLVDVYAFIIGSKYIASALFLGHNSALAVAVVVVLLWNFFVNRYWTYNDVSAHGS